MGTENGRVALCTAAISEQFSFEPRTRPPIGGTVERERHWSRDSDVEFGSKRLELRSDLAELKRLAGWLKAQAQQELSADTSFAIQLCLEEAVANIIMHGGGAKDDRLRIAIELERNAGTLVASIEDSGREFDPTQFPPPSVAKSLEEAKVGDLGIHLMHSFASDMHYERRDGRNRLTLRFVELH